MKNKLISLFLAFSLLSASNAFAARNSENYRFMHDLINCLYRLELAARYSIEGVEYEKLLGNLNNQVPRLQKAKEFMKDWLESRDKAIRATARGIYADISNIETAAGKLIKTLNRPPREAYLSLFSKYAREQGEAWNNTLKTSSLAVWVIIEPAESDNPQGELPFIISDQERRSLIKYLDKLFGRSIKHYEELVRRREKGEISEIKMDIPVWAALNLHSLLKVDTYEEAANIGQ
ncbi:MAG: hypothetical protein JSV30_00150 [Candidatus Omnitrophota bacterium]|nr:MAG: hypothetical protein JSV30_00150 [Candidatus Omnitrophota bacterium]